VRVKLLSRRVVPVPWVNDKRHDWYAAKTHQWRTLLVTYTKQTINTNRRLDDTAGINITHLSDSHVLHLLLDVLDLLRLLHHLLLHVLRQHWT